MQPFKDINRPDQDTARRVLWITVLIKAFSDANSRNQKSEYSYLQQRARLWIEASYGDFKDDRHEVCELAGINPEALDDSVRRYGIAAIAQRLHDTLFLETERGRRKKRETG